MAEWMTRDLRHSTALLEDSFFGTLFGTAIGDQLGAPFEGRLGEDLTDDLVSGNWGKEHSTYTDDTQLTLWLARAISAQDGFVQEEFAQNLVKWLDEPPIGAGQGCISSAKNIQLGRPLSQVASSSGGNGTAMRVSPVGLFYRNDPQALREAATRSSLLTHSHPGATIGAQAVALAVGYNSRTNEDFFHMDAFLTTVEDIRLDPAPPQLAVYRKGLELVKKWVFRGSLDEAIRELGQLGVEAPFRFEKAEGKKFVHPYAISTVNCAFLVFLRHLADPERTFLDAVKAGGDTDTVAAIAGALAGSLYGYGRLPSKWRDSVWNKKILKHAAESLFKAYERKING